MVTKIVRDQFYQLKVHKLMRYDRTYSRAPRELADIIADAVINLAKVLVV